MTKRFSSTNIAVCHFFHIELYNMTESHDTMSGLYQYQISGQEYQV